MNRRIFLMAAGSTLALPLGNAVVPVAFAAPANAVAPIAASTVLQQAQRYLGLPYKYGGADPAVGLDCSAYISLAWEIPRQTTDTIQGWSYQINKSDLRPGDAMNLGFNGRADHMRIFAGWATADQTIVWVYEAAFRFGVSYHVVGYDERYTPIRRLAYDTDVPLPDPTMPLDYDLQNGHFYSQTAGNDGLTGYSVTDDGRFRSKDGINLWSEFRRLGGVDTLGWPLTGRFNSWGNIVQIFQQGVLKWDPDSHTAYISPLPPDVTTAATPEALTPERTPLLPKAAGA